MKNKLYRYIASFDHILEQYDGNLYTIQEKYIESEEPITFHPFTFLASNMDYFQLKYHGNLKYESYYILEQGKCTQRCEDDITCMYIDLKKESLKKKTPMFESNLFDVDAYASMYHYYIETYYGRSYNKDMKEVERFYIEYGYWNGMKPKPVDGMIYLASIAHKCSEEERNMSDYEAVKHHFKNKSNELLFNPYLYLVSNWNVLSKFVSVDHCINERQLAKHYICNQGKQLKLHSFDHYTYLANNVPYIEELMVTKKGRKVYDIVNINPINAAKIFIKHKGVSAEKFDPVQFVKMYIDDEYINYDKKLSVANAAKYFVRGYVHSNIVRWRTTWRYKTLHFLRNRIYDSIRQTPFHLIRAIACK